MGNKNRGVRLRALNWDEECKLDLINGNGFRITEPAIKGSAKLYNGIQSERFGTDFDSEEGFSERYRCTRGCTTGKVFEGSKCPVCGGIVEFKDIDLSVTGWMIMDDHMIIHPIFYNKLEWIIGEKAFKEIITFDKMVSKNGALEQKSTDQGEPLSPFYGIGVSGFIERFDEIIDYYKIKKKNKLEDIEDLLQNRKNLFTHCIPVYSAILRPMSFKGESLFYCTPDKIYNKIYSAVRLLNDIELYETRRKKLSKDKRERMDIPHILTNIQLNLMQLWELIFDQVAGKHGQIQGEIIGGMLSWSSRNVIIPDPTLKADEVRLNYAAFLELYRFEIIGEIMRVNGVSASEAMNQWALAKIQYNPKVYEIMNYLLKKETRRILINRNPTINFGSLLCVKIKSVKNDSQHDYTMSMPLQILSIMNADQSRSEDTVMYLVL